MSTSPDIQSCLAPSSCIDSGNKFIVSLVDTLVEPNASELENAVTLYYWVRDEIRYNPYSVSEDISDYRASVTLRAREGWCVTKAIVLAALCRAAHIPARLGFADVRNHLSTARMREMMQTDIFFYHGYTAIYLNKRWVKATPAFNVELCDRFGLKALEFDGLEDSIYHPFDQTGNRHMEYLNDRGQHLDLPYDDMMAVFRDHYPRMMQMLSAQNSGEPDETRWWAEVEAETSSLP